MHLQFLASRVARGLAAAIVFVGLAMQAAAAEQMVFAGQTLNIEPPAGYCALDRSRAAEASLLAAQEGAQRDANRIALAFVECNDLAKARQSGTYDLAAYGMVLVPLQHGDVVKYTGSRSGFVAEAAAHFGDFDADKAIETAKARIKESGVTVTGVRMLGVLAKDDAALYLGVTLDGVADASGGSPRRVLGIVAFTLVNEIAVSINIYQAGASEDAIPAMIAQDKANVAALIAANANLEAESRRWVVMGIDLSGVARAALMGAAAGALVGAVLFLLKRLRKGGTG
ncbi:MAG TPA: hypothetical protein VMU06_18660 [Stellaceae bacterium]|nr:hypothetical protein [Stellaceae bacterium]